MGLIYVVTDDHSWAVDEFDTGNRRSRGSAIGECRMAASAAVGPRRRNGVGQLCSKINDGLASMG